MVQHDDHPQLHSEVDKQLSFNESFNADGDEEAIPKPDAMHRAVAREPWNQQTLSLVVVGASGDLAKKKTYPSLLYLFQDNLLPANTVIWGYARSAKTHQELRDHLYPHLIKTGSPEIVVQEFLAKCFYHSGESYGDEKAYTEMIHQIANYEAKTPSAACNRLFYLAIPPNVFGETGIAIKNTGMAMTGWTRVIIEKPFGRDLASCQKLLQTLSKEFDEHHIYRIDHYLGKEVVQNIMLFRFGNSWLEHMWSKDAIQSVTISFKEPFGTEGRGGYFDHYGIIRDILQNHLLQVLALVAMEPPQGDDGDAIRDAKTQVLKNMDPLSLDDVLLGQYHGYSDDPTIPIENKDTNCPTYCAIRCQIHTPRWEGVPFILQAGKALDEQLCEVRIRFKPPKSLYAVQTQAKKLQANELVMRLQPDPALEMTTNIKTPGLANSPIQTSLSMNYKTLETVPGKREPDAYTRLLLDVLRGRQGSFVRDDELERSWELFTPLLHQIERDNIPPHPYHYGSKGPSSRDAWMTKMGVYETPIAAAQAATATPQPLQAAL